MVSEDKFITITDVVIDKLEGGYYHPQMLADGRVKDSRYSNSGETLFGLDRKAGAGLSKYPQWQQFWSKVDSTGASNKWSWNYMGGSQAPDLKKLAGKVMYQEYNNLYNRYLSPESQKLVDSDARLTFNFAYAAWNGSGWFQRFANALNTAVASGERNKDKLVSLVVSQRTNSSNSLIAQGGRKISGFINNIQFVEFVTKNKKNILYLGIGLILLGVSYFVFKSKNK